VKTTPTITELALVVIAVFVVLAYFTGRGLG
jgi:hypothetical protein